MSLQGCYYLSYYSTPPPAPRPIQTPSVLQIFLFLFRHGSILGTLHWLFPLPQTILTMNNLASFNCLLVCNPP